MFARHGPSSLQLAAASPPETAPGVQHLNPEYDPCSNHSLVQRQTHQTPDSKASMLDSPWRTENPTSLNANKYPHRSARICYA